MMNCTIENNCTHTKPGFFEDSFGLFFFCLLTNFCFGFLTLVALASYRCVRLRRHGKHTVGVVQSSETKIQKTKDGTITLYILNVVFQVQHCQETLDTTEECNPVCEDGMTMDSDKQPNKKDPESWIFIRKNVSVPTLEIYNEAVETSKVMLIFDPKSPRSSATPVCVVVNQQSNTCCSVFGRIFCIIFVGMHLVALLCFGCTLLFSVFMIWLYNVKHESVLQGLFTCMVAILPSFMLGCCIYCCRKDHGNTQDELDGVDLEEVAAANSLPYMINSTENYDLEYTSGEVDSDVLQCEITTMDHDKMLV